MKRILLIVCLIILPLLTARAVSAGYFRIDETGKVYFVQEGQVLSRGSDAGDSSGSSANNSSGSSDEDDEEEPDSSESSDSSGPGSGETETRVEIRTSDERVRTEVEEEDGETRVRSEVRLPWGRIRIELRDGRLVVREDDENEDEFEDEDEDEATDSAERLEIEEHEFTRGVRVRARGDRLEIEQRGIGALLHFPLTIGENNELIVITPAGTKVVTILPAVAVANILQSNIMDRVLALRASQATASATPVATTSAQPLESPPGSPSAVLESPVLTPQVSPTPEEIEEIELTLVNGTLTYKIKGEKNMKFLRVFSFTAPVTAQVSAETGEVLSIDRPFLLRFLPFLFSE